MVFERPEIRDALLTFLARRARMNNDIGLMADVLKKAHDAGLSLDRIDPPLHGRLPAPSSSSDSIALPVPAVALLQANKPCTMRDSPGGGAFGSHTNRAFREQIGDVDY